MALLVFNQSGVAVTLTGFPHITVPASPAPPANGPAFNVSSELKGRTGPQYTALEAQRIAAPLYYEWTGLPEYPIGTLIASSAVVTPPSAVILDPVANVAALATVNDGTAAEGTKVYVLTLKQPFVLYKADNVTAIDGITTAATMSGNGRWRRMLEHVPAWTDQTAWFVNWGAGNDEAAGAIGTPLKTMAEFTRRVRVAKYNSNFGPYEIKLQDHVLAANDSFQWGPMIDSGKGTLVAALDGGIGTTLVRIRGTKTLSTLGTVAAYTAPVGNAVSTVTRAVGAFTAGETYEWNGNITLGLAGKRFTVTEAGVPAVGRLNPWQLEGSVPVVNDTFQLVGLTKFGVQLGNYALPAGARIDIVDCEFPTVADGGVANYEIQNYVLRILNSVMKVFIGGGIGARVRIGGAYASDVNGATSGSVAIIAPALNAASSVWTCERGYVSPTFCTSLNVIWDVLNVGGVFAASRTEFQGGCVRRSGLGAAATSNSSQGPTFCRIDRSRFFDVPSVVVGNPLEGGAGDPGAALILRRGGWAQIKGIVGQSVNVGTSGVDLSEGAKLWVHDIAGATPTTITGNAGRDIVFEGVTNAMPALENYAGVSLPALSPMTTWAQWSAAPFSGNVQSYKTGSAIVTVA